MSTDTDIPDALFREHRRWLWGLSYRMTGSAADADDVVQDTFVRALERPPEDRARPWRPWLTRVAVNVARDRLRRRRRQTYVGPWLPSPIDTTAAPEEETPEGRYGRLESVTMAFLVALEALTPQQRAVLILRDVYDASVRDVAEVLGLSESNVKVSHHRARAAMRRYDGARSTPTPQRRQSVEVALGRLVDALSRRDERALADLLADEVVTLNDGGGEHLAALKPIDGKERVARFYVGLAQRSDTFPEVEVRELNGLPALAIRLEPSHPRQASRLALHLDVGDDGLIRAIHLVLASAKLAPIGLGPGG